MSTITSLIPWTRPAHRKVVPLALTGLVVILAGGFAVRNIIRRPVAVASDDARTLYGAPLGLQANRRLDGIHVTWDRSSEYVRTAESGSLRLMDGPQITVVPLSQSQIRYGQYFLTPYSENIQISLDVVSGDKQKLQETTGVTVELAEAVSPAAHPQEFAAAVRALEAETAAMRARQASPPAKPAVQPPVDSTPPASGPASENVRPVPSQLAVSLPAPSLKALQSLQRMPVQNTPVQSPPVSAPAPQSNSAATETAQIPARQIPAQGAPAEITQGHVALPQSPPAAASQPQTPLPQVGSVGVSAPFVPASPVLQSAIVLPEILKGAVRAKPQEITVVAEIDSSGRIKNLRPQGSLTGLQNNLLNVARPTVMSWRYKPARLGDKPVDSEFVLHLRFGGPSR